MRGKRLPPQAAIPLVLIVLAVIAYVPVQLFRPVPVMTLAASRTPLRALPGSLPHPAWPSQGQAAVGALGVGTLAAHGGNQPVPIASVAKIMTAYIVLHDHPLRVGEAGPALRVTAADVAAYAREKSQGESVVKVAAGERLTELQALEAMLIPSGNNIAALLAGWDAGSQPAFVQKMNSQARVLGLRHTRYADASGVNSATVSTASDQFRLTAGALGLQVFRQIVAMPQVTLPTAGLSYNVNYALGHDGIVGVKTGSSPEAGGCLVFAATRSVAGTPATIVGVVLGVRATAAQPSMLAGVISSSEKLLRSVSGNLERVQVIKPGTVLGHVNSAWTTGPAAAAASGVTVTGWPGTWITVMVTPRRLGHTLSKGQPVAVATVTVGEQVQHITLRASAAVRPPSARWLLTRL